MPVWRLHPITTPPSLTLVRWQVFQAVNPAFPADRPTRHFVGHCLEYGEGCASPAVMAFDDIRLKGLTTTGRVYLLHGEPGVDPDSAYVWQMWMVLNELSESIDVTAEVAALAWPRPRMPKASPPRVVSHASKPPNRTP